MNFETYQLNARKTAIYPGLGNNYIYPTLGLVGESGEVAEKIKKVLRDKKGVFDQETLIGLKKELGDVLWYVSNICSELDFSLEDIAEENLNKLKKRSLEGKINGSGDNR